MSDGKIVIDTDIDSSGFKEGLSKLKHLANSGMNAAMGIMKEVAAVSVGAVVAGVGTIAKSAIDSYAKYEQLVGGVDKLYKDASGKLQMYADQAYKTSGISANKYMETATSFSSALIKSLGGDTQKAADLTDVAMRAMSDNVNVFGSNMTDVENAFKGFAKQNYTMLDNLKLGYGGTKSEMEKLIEDANTYRASIGETSDLSIDSFADIVVAIQSVQEAQGIAGTTAKEAMTTIEGSAAATRAAWENVLTAIGRGDGMSEAMQGLVESLFGDSGGTGLLSQIISRVQTIFEGIGTFVATASPYILDRFPELISGIVPGFIEASATMLSTLASALPGLASGLYESMRQIALQFGPLILEQAPTMLSTGAKMLASLIDGLLSGLPSLLTNVGEMLTSAVKYLMTTGIPALANAAVTLMSGLATSISQNLPAILKSVLGIVQGIAATFLNNAPTMIKSLVSAFLQAAKAAVTAFKNVDWMGLGKSVFTMLVNAVKGVGNLLSSALKAIGSAALGVFKAVDWSGTGRAVINFISSAIQGTASKIVNALKTIGTNALNSFKGIDWKGLGRMVITFIANAVNGAKTLVVNALKAAGTNAMNAFKSIDWKNVGSAVINGIKNGITSTASSIADAAKSAARKALDAAKNFLGIHSPSKVFCDQVGKMMGLGAAEGLELSADDMSKAARSAAENAVESAESAIKPVKMDLAVEQPKPIRKDILPVRPVIDYSDLVSRFERVIDQAAMEIPAVSTTVVTGNILGTPGKEVQPLINERIMDAVAEKLAVRFSEAVSVALSNVHFDADGRNIGKWIAPYVADSIAVPGF